MKRESEPTKKRKCAKPLQLARKRVKKEVLPFPEEQRDEFYGVEWLCSHLFPREVLWSSDPTKLEPSICTSTRTTAGTENEVVNTWFVNEPTITDTGAQSHWEAELKKASEFVENAISVLIVAGAGIGVDSGLPDYRGPNGFWRAYPQLAQEGLSLEDMSHPDWFKNDPKSAWGFYAHRAKLYLSAVPHKLLREITRQKNENYFIFTSNIDNQFQVADFDENKIYEAHGCLKVVQCINDECNEIWELGLDELPTNVDENLKFAGDISELPHCPKCKSLGRPNVSMFGDTCFTWNSSRSAFQKKQFKQWLKKTLGCDTKHLQKKTVEVKPEVKEEKAEDAPTRRSTRIRASRPNLVIIELGCGISLHSLRLEVDLLVSLDTKAEVHCVRINPSHHQVPPGDHVGIGMGAKDGMEGISKFLNVKVEK